jgi:RNA polymerase sigma-70 factor, ECF subfamily
LGLFRPTRGSATETTPQTQRAAEAELLREVGRGDVDALRDLYRSFERPLYTLGVRWLRDPKLAEELVQEVTLRVWRRAHTFDPRRGSAGSWIFGVARNVAADLARARGKHPVPIGHAAARAAAPWDEEAAWRSWQVASALRELPVEQQKVLELAYVRQFTHSEIAEALRIPLGTVKSRIYEGLRKLRVRLADLGIVEEGAS